jgi:hypothetical protein
VVSFTPWPLCPQKHSAQYPLDRRLGGPEPVWKPVSREKSLTLAGNRILAIQPVITPTELTYSSMFSSFKENRVTAFCLVCTPVTVFQAGPLRNFGGFIPSYCRRLFCIASIPALKPTLPPIQWVLGIKQPELECDHSPPYNSEVKNT